MMGEHIIMCCGAKVRIHNGVIELLTSPRVLHCPLHGVLYNLKAINEEAVIKSVGMKIKDFGFCTRQRQFDDSLIVPYGASEMIKTCLENGLLDCAVTACEGAGTVISWSPSLVQGIGARLTGIVKTSPIPEIIKYIESHGGKALDPTSATINQTRGVKKAIKMGFRSIAVTVTSFQAKEITKIREIEQKENVNVTIFSVCNTIATESDMEHIQNADIICSSASTIIRKQIGPKALMQLGVTVPVFALTYRGKQTFLTHLSRLPIPIAAFRARLPYLVEGRGPTQKPGTHLSQTT